jgi:hypothetical protein
MLNLMYAFVQEPHGVTSQKMAFFISFDQLATFVAGGFVPPWPM